MSKPLAAAGIDEYLAFLQRARHPALRMQGRGHIGPDIQANAWSWSGPADAKRGTPLAIPEGITSIVSVLRSAKALPVHVNVASR